MKNLINRPPHDLSSGPDDSDSVQFLEVINTIITIFSHLYITSLKPQLLFKVRKSGIIAFTYIFVFLCSITSFFH